jgi:2-polyprenyl-3-methyl-5-hydroxy-6-metoxy-1,4-benzoquinol methylase
VDISQEMINVAKRNHPEANLEFICADVEKFDIDEKFDYIILNNTLGEIEDIQGFFNKIRKFATNDTRIIIHNYNRLWRPLLAFGEKIRLKMPEMTRNWLSIDDIENFLHIFQGINQ